MGVAEAAACQPVEFLSGLTYVMAGVLIGMLWGMWLERGPHDSPCSGEGGRGDLNPVEAGSCGVVVHVLRVMVKEWGL